MNQNKLLNFLLALTLVGATSCATTYSSPRNVRQYDENIFQHSEVISAEDISISLEAPKNQGVEGLIETTDNYLEYIEFRKEYSKDAKDIMTVIENCSKGLDSLVSVDKLVRDLGKRLENDENQYAQQYFEKIKDFEYIRRDYYSAEIGERGNLNKRFNPLAFVHAATFMGIYTAVEIPLLILPEERKAFSEQWDHVKKGGSSENYDPRPTTRSTVQKKYYNEFRVRPFTGDEEVLKERVRVE
ncbi:MAG: hypothetical protein ABIH72_02580 [archaeon]